MKEFFNVSVREIFEKPVFRLVKFSSTGVVEISQSSSGPWRWRTLWCRPGKIKDGGGPSIDYSWWPVVAHCWRRRAPPATAAPSMSDGEKRRRPRHSSRPGGEDSYHHHYYLHTIAKVIL